MMSGWRGKTPWATFFLNPVVTQPQQLSCNIHLVQTVIGNWPEMAFHNRYSPSPPDCFLSIVTLNDSPKVLKFSVAFGARAISGFQSRAIFSGRLSNL